MPTITLQVGQCGNQLGQQLWSLLDAQRHGAQQQQGSSFLPGCEAEFFKPKLTTSSTNAARCILVDTEPKVVGSILRNDAASLFSARRAYLGQSGRGNNWAYGYSQLHRSRPQDVSGESLVRTWDACTRVDAAGHNQEACSLDTIMEGVQREAEACDTAPNFLLLHALAGGSGSGLGSRLLEAIREEFPLNSVAAVPVAPRIEGDSPMQQLNAVMALSFLQAYADVVLLYNNTDLLQQLGKAGRSISLHDMNAHIAQSVLGALWPLDTSEVAGAHGRIRDMVCTVAADPCMKLVQSTTVPLSTALGAKGLWQEACKTLRQSQSRFDVLDDNTEIVITSAMLLARGVLPGQAVCTASTAGWPPATPNTAPDSQQYIQAGSGAAGFATPADASGCVFTRSSPQRLVLHTGSSGRLALQDSGGKSQSGLQGAGLGSSTPAATAVVNSSAVVGMLSHVCRSAEVMCSSGAYMHWYERSGCSTAAVREAIEVVQGMADSYRLATGIRDFL